MESQLKSRAESLSLSSNLLQRPRPFLPGELQIRTQMCQTEPTQLADLALSQPVTIAGDAQANVRQAELNLQRTRVVAPFDCYVRSEQVEISQFLNAGSPVATVAGTDQTDP